MEDTPNMAHEVIRMAVRQLIDDSGLKHLHIADKLNVTPKHLSSMLTGRSGLDIDWVHKIVNVCGRALRIEIEPHDWVDDIITYRARATAAEEIIADLELLHAKQERPVKNWNQPCERHTFSLTGNYNAIILEDLRTCPDCRFTEYEVCSHCQCPHDVWPCPTMVIINRFRSR